MRRLSHIKLVNEFNEIFSDLFNIKSSTYKKMVLALANGPLAIKDLCKILHIEQSGFVSECMEDLVDSGFISRDYTWHISSGDVSKFSNFRLSDNYLRFYLKYIDKNKFKIDNDEFVFKSLTALPGWESIMGFQFENLVLKNRKLVKDYLGLKPEDIIADSPFFQRKTLRQAGCQIDYLIQTKFNTLYACEIKFAKSAITTSIITEMQNKLSTLSYPKGFSIRPVLIHVNGVNTDVIESGFFAEIVDFGQFLVADSM